MTQLTLPSRCDRAAAEALVPELIEALGSGTVEIDASGTEHVGLAMLQVLASARAGFEHFAIAPSDALVDAARLSGLSHILFDGDA